MTWEENVNQAFLRKIRVHLTFYTSGQLYFYKASDQVFVSENIQTALWTEKRHPHTHNSDACTQMPILHAQLPLFVSAANLTEKEIYILASKIWLSGDAGSPNIYDIFKRQRYWAERVLGRQHPKEKVLYILVTYWSYLHKYSRMFKVIKDQYQMHFVRYEYTCQNSRINSDLGRRLRAQI